MIEIILSREQITPDWLTRVLTSAGINATVAEVDIEPIIAGYYGSSSRLTVRYEQPDDSLPRSLFLKIATENQTAREHGAEGGMYRYEVGFYSQLADKVNISTPKCYAAEISDDGSAFVLLLEDAAPFKQPDQIQGLSLAQARLAMQELAGLHAATWQGKNMQQCDWAKSDAATMQGFAQAMGQLRPVFVERFGAHVPAENLEVLDVLAANSEACWRYQLEAKNLVATHCDFRGDNMLFGERDGKLAMVTIDWTALFSCGGRDLAHFLGTSVLPELRKEHEIDLVTHYHKALVAQGVSAFGLQECIDDYRINLFYPAFVVVSVTPSVDVDERGQRLFLSMFNRACQAIRESDALALIDGL